MRMMVDPVFRPDDPEEYKQWQRDMHAAGRRGVPVEGLPGVLREAGRLWGEPCTERVQWALSRLERRERLVIWLRYLDDPPATQVEVAEAIGISQQRVSQLESSALADLKTLLGL